MRSWKRRTRAQHRARYRAWQEREVGDNTRDHVSRWARNHIEGFKASEYHPSWLQPFGLKIWRRNYLLKQSRARKHVKEGMALFAKYPYYEDCRYHVCKPTKVMPDCPGIGRIDVDGESIINGTPSSCSYEHCGIRHLTKEEGEERAEFAKTYGMLPYQLRWVYATQGLTVEQNTNSIRAHMKQDAEWKFNEHGGTEMFTEQGRQWIIDNLGIDVSLLAPMTDEEMDQLYGA